MSVLPAKYSLDNLAMALRKPGMFLGELDYLGNRINTAVHRRVYDGVGTRVVDEAWDNLLILDGCRFDTFEEVADLEGRLESRISRGSESWEFLHRNFAGEAHHDTVYVTANPHWYKLPDGTFHHVRNLLGDAWDPDLQTVPPAEVVDAALETIDRFPNKRLVVHFMQPHFPFIGETGRQLDQSGLERRLKRDDDSGAGFETSGADAGSATGENMLIWGKVRWRLLDASRVRRAYRENLGIVLEHVSRLVDELAGRTVVSSDHGNLFGERLFPVPSRGFGHPSGLYADALRRVPWHVVPGSRRQVRSDPPVTERSIDEDVAQDRLQALGYVE